MAYQAPILDEDEKKKVEGQSAINTSGVVDGFAGGANTVGSADAASTAKTPGTGFVNLQQYLDANKGEGGRMAGATTAELASEADGYSGKAQDVVKSSADDFTAAAGGDTADRVAAGIQKDASGIYSDASDFLGQGYGGPLATDLTAGLAADRTDLNSRLGEVDNQDVQRAALQKTYGGGTNYTQGFGLLDQFLIQGTESGRNKLAEVKGKTKDVDNAYESTSATLSEAEKQARANLTGNQGRVRETAGATLKGIIAAGTGRIAGMDSKLDVAGRDGTVGASLGDTLTKDEQIDLDALAALTGAEKGDWYKRTYNEGIAKPAPQEVPWNPDMARWDAARGILVDAVTGKPMGHNPLKPLDGKRPDKYYTETVKPVGTAIGKEIHDSGVLEAPSPGAPVVPVGNSPLPKPPSVSDARKKWCLARGTRVEMIDGTKAIQDIQVGDVTLFGGKVTEIHSVLSDSVYLYNDTLVAEGHAVFSDGAWTRIGEVGARHLGSFIVYPMSTENHVILVGQTVFADYVEVPGLDSDEECLAVLNSPASVANAADLEAYLARPELKKA